MECDVDGFIGGFGEAVPELDGDFFRFEVADADAEGEFVDLVAALDGFGFWVSVRSTCTCGSTPKPTETDSPMATSGRFMRPTKSLPTYMVARPGEKHETAVVAQRRQTIDLCGRGRGRAL